MAFKMKGQSMYPSGMKSHVKGHDKQQGPIPEKNIKLQKSENKDTYVYEASKGMKQNLLLMKM